MRTGDLAHNRSAYPEAVKTAVANARAAYLSACVNTTWEDPASCTPWLIPGVYGRIVLRRGSRGTGTIHSPVYAGRTLWGRGHRRAFVPSYRYQVSITQGAVVGSRGICTKWCRAKSIVR